MLKQCLLMTTNSTTKGRFHNGKKINLSVVSKASCLLLLSNLYRNNNSNTVIANAFQPSYSSSTTATKAGTAYTPIRTNSASFHSPRSKLSFGMTATSTEVEDPYIWLEDVESDQSLAFAKDANAACLAQLGDPKDGETYGKVLKILESDDRIPFAGFYGVDEGGEMILFNFWKDSKNPKGIWRKTTLSSYQTPSPKWTTVVDIDELGKKDDTSWVFKGSGTLSRSLDCSAERPTPPNLVSRTLMKLSRGGADAIVVREFDLETNEFIPASQNGFEINAEAKTSIGWKSRNVVLVGTDIGENALTDSGYPRTVREWVRGTPLEEAPIVFEGEQTDVSVNSYISDQRMRPNGSLFEFRSRSPTFFTTIKYIRKIPRVEYLFAPDDPDRLKVEAEEGSIPEFVLLDVQEDANAFMFANFLMISLKSDWTVGGKTYKSGSLLATNNDDFLTLGKENVSYQVLFNPSDRIALGGLSSTKSYLVLDIKDNVKSKLQFYKISNDGSAFEYVGGDSEAKIRSSSIRALDATTSDEFWFTTSSYTQPTTLYMGNADLVAKEGEAMDTSFPPTSEMLPEPYVTKKVKSLPPQYDSDSVTVVQKTATSKDGTQIPYFLVLPKAENDLPMDGSTPTLLYGYGGFQISLGPQYIPSQGLTWLERGGAYVEANIRGGGEFGPSWHQAGLKSKKNKSYEDFIAVAEDLIASGLCQPSTLGIRGGSNGGLLVGNMLTMRPDLFGAIHCAVPLLDMKRYHTLLAGASWMAEYGDPSTDDWKEFLNRYSPYHNIDPKASYPPILITTSTRDDRVHPGHARKMVQKMNDLGEGKWPVYYYENIEGGHGGAADPKQSAFMTSLAWDFLWNTLSKKESV